MNQLVMVVMLLKTFQVKIQPGDELSQTKFKLAANQLQF